MAEVSFARLAYDAAVVGLEKQERVLDELRSRAGLLLAASSLSASFLGPTALDDGQPWLLAGALAAFAVSVGGSIVVLIPRSSFTFSIFGATMYEELFEFREDLDEVYRRLAYDFDGFWEANDAAMQPLFSWFRRAAIALGTEVVLLFGSVSDTLVW